MIELNAFIEAIIICSAAAQSAVPAELWPTEAAVAVVNKLPDTFTSCSAAKHGQQNLRTAYFSGINS